MKRVLQRFLALMMVLWTSSQLSAQSFTVDGINYNVLSEAEKTCEVGNNKSLEGDVTIPESVTYNGAEYVVIGIGENAFRQSGLTSIKLPNTLGTIGRDAFHFCNKLNSLKIPMSVINIGKEAFYGCFQLRKLIFGGQMPPEGSISNEIDLRMVIYVPEGCANSYQQAYGQLPNNFVLDVPIVEGDGSIDYMTGFESGGVKYLVRPLGSSTVEASSRYNMGETNDCRGKVELPETVSYEGNSYTVNAIAPFGFWASDELTELILPKTIENIGDNAATTCKKLTKIVMKGAIPSKLHYRSGFANYWTVVYVPDGSLGVYEQCTDFNNNWAECNLVEGDGTKDYLTHFQSDNLIYTVNDWRNDGSEVSVASFVNKEAEIVIPSSVVYEDREFVVDKIRKTGLYNNSNLKSVVIPESIKEIGQQAFWDCRNLQSVTVLAKQPPICETRDEYTFSQNIYTTCTLYVPDGAIETYRKANVWKSFSNIEAIKAEVVVDKNTYSVDGDNATVVSVDETSPEIVIPETITKDGKEYKVQSIGKGAFDGCDLMTKLTLPAGINSIQANTFGQCEQLKEIHIYAVIPPVFSAEIISRAASGMEFTDEVYDKCLVYVPTGSLESYRNAPVWENFKNILEMGTEPSLTLDTEEASVNVGETIILTATVIPDNATLSWESSNEEVATVNNGEVLGVKGGDAIITVTSSNGFSASCKITVKVPMTGIELDKTEAEGYIGGTIQLTATVKPEDTTDDTTVTWTSSDKDVATVDRNGLVSCLAEGEAVITATCGEFSAKCTVTVTDRPPFVGITSLTLSETEVELPLNYTYSLFAIIAPENATNTELEWSTSNPDVARVYQGVVYGIVPGEAVITAKTTDGSNLSASCKFTIVATSGIEGTEGDGVEVTAAAGVITVKGATMGSTVEVYSMSGACVAAKTVESSVEEFPIAASGIYVVRVGGKAFKVAL